MNRYQDVDKKQLQELHNGLEILEELDHEAIGDLDLFLYCLTNSEAIVDAAKEAIADSMDLNEADVILHEIAVAIPLSSGSIYSLTGSGIHLKNEEFAYMGEPEEGVRTETFTFSSFKPAAAVSDFSQMAIAMSVSWIEDFLKQYGNKQPAEIKQNVHRTEEATQPTIPVAPEPAAPTQSMPKQTSLKLSEIVDSLLG